MNEYIYITAAYAVLIFTFSFCGILRLCNLFPHAIKNMEDIYPARRLVVGIYFSVLLLFPCMIYPQSYDAQLLARCFWIIYIPLSASLAFRRFFHTDRRMNRKEYTMVGAIPVMAVLILFAFAVVGGDSLLRYKDIAVNLMELISIALTVYLTHVTLGVWNLIHAHREETVASPSSVPLHFALGIFWLPLVAQIMAWGVHLYDSAFASATLAAATAVMGAVILVAILRPQRIANDNTYLAESCDSEYEEDMDDEDNMDDEEDMDSDEDMEMATKLPVSAIDRIEQQVRDAVEHDQMYLNPNLTKATLVSQLGINNLYLHIVIKERFGTFNKYINTLRMEYAMRYENEHPEVKREELALKSGFGSVRTYYRAKTQYELERSDSQTVTKS